MSTNHNFLGGYAAANQFLGDKVSRHWPSIRYTTINRHAAIEGAPIAVRYHWTDVVTYYSDGRIMLDSNGHETHTTKARINDFCRAANICVSQTNFSWTVRTKAGEFPFKDHMIILPDGNVEGQPKIIYNENFGNVRLEIKEFAPYARTLTIHLNSEAKRDATQWMKVNKGMRSNDAYLYELMEGVIANSEWEWLRVVDLEFLTDDKLPILSMDSYTDRDGELFFCQWAYALSDYLWVIEGLENAYKSGKIPFKGVCCKMISKQAASQIHAIFIALAEYVANSTYVVFDGYSLMTDNDNNTLIFDTLEAAQDQVYEWRAESASVDFRIVRLKDANLYN